MKRWERRRADADDDGRDEEAPVAGGDALGRRPRRPHHGGGTVARPHRGPGRSARGGHGGERGRPSRWGRMGNDRGGGGVRPPPPRRSRRRGGRNTPRVVVVVVVVVIRHRGGGRRGRCDVVRRRCVTTREKNDSEVNVDSKDLKQKLTSIENYECLG